MDKQTISYQKANLFKRLVADFIDTLCIVIIVFIAYIVIKDNDEYAPIVSAGCGLYYFFTKDGFSNGQSIGKQIMGLMVVNLATNLPCTTNISFLRQIILLMALPVEIVMLFTQKQRRRLGDFAAKTQVIEATEYEKQKRT
jgi:uncharacterized RDD family membrane protein YckC